MSCHAMLCTMCLLCGEKNRGLGMGRKVSTDSQHSPWPTHSGRRFVMPDEYCDFSGGKDWITSTEYMYSILVCMVY